MTDSPPSIKLPPYTRRDDWSERLTETILEAQTRAQEIRMDWNNTTCAVWTMKMVEAMTDFNPYEWITQELSQQIDSEYTAMKLIRKSGFETLEGLVCSLFEEKPLVYLQKGDLLLIPSQQMDPSDEAFQEGDPQFAGVNIMGLAIADPPLFWSIGYEGLCKGYMTDLLNFPEETNLPKPRAFKV